MKNVFTIAKMMWMCFECGTYARKENRRTTCVHHNVRHHNAGSAPKIEVLAIADEIGFHSGRATVPAAASAALKRRNEIGRASCRERVEGEGVAGTLERRRE